MLFLYPYLLLGLTGISVPVIIHLFNRRHARSVKWGAMRFLMESLFRRRRSLLLEEMLLLAARCLIVGCAVLAMARPFVPGGASFPWWLVLPLGMLGIIFFGISFALDRYRKWQICALLTALLTLAICVGAIMLERRLSLNNRFAGGSARDVALVIDGSSSMTLEFEGASNFNRAREEAAQIIEEAPQGVAFSLIVAGAVPDPLVPAPVTDRKYLLDALAQAQPVHGVMSAPDTLAAAAASLAQGTRAAKQIILIGDGQSEGWKTGDLESWRLLEEAFECLPAKPSVFVRALELKQGIRNLTVKDVAFSRPVVGTDRDVRVNVTLANTGREAVTPASVRLRIGGDEKTDRSVGQLVPDAEQVVTFLHRFDKPGAQVVEAQVMVDDELTADNSMRRVMQVINTLKVLVVDDGRAVRLFDRGGGYVSLGLAPAAKALRQEHQKRRDKDGETPRFLMKPELIAASGLGLKRSLTGYAVAVLADVPSLPAEQAAQLADFTRRGGSLLLIHGVRADAAFFNGWMSDGQQVAPLQLGACVTVTDSKAQNGVMIAPDTFRHPALALFRESGDLADAVLTCYREAVAEPEAPGIGGRLQNGAVFLAEKTLGRGRVMQLFVPLDRTSGTLVMRRAFLPLIQELTAYLAQPSVATLNIPPSRGATVQLSSSALTHLAGSGVYAEYFKRGKMKQPLLTRVDPTLDFDWGRHAPAAGVPSEQFAVKWRGSFIPKRSGVYTFHVQANDRLTLKIGTNELNVTSKQQPQTMQGGFTAGERYPLTALFEQDRGESAVKVEMTGPDFARASLPGDWLTPVLGDSEAWDDALTTDLSAPGGRARQAKIRSGEDGIALRTDSPLMQGIYGVRVPADAAEWLEHLAGTNAVFPICVTENPAESRLDALTPDEQAILQGQLNLSVAHTYDDLRSALSGKNFGRELWRIPALVLFILLILEAVLTRWIFIQRKSDAEAIAPGNGK